MFHLATRFFAVLIMSLAFLTTLSTPVGTAAQGTSEVVLLCQKGGWQKLAPSESNTVAFGSQSECVSYAAQGGRVVDLVVTRLFLSGGFTAMDGFLHGTGFTPGSTITLITYDYFGHAFGLVGGLVVDSNGAFVAGGYHEWCDVLYAGYPTITFTVEIYPDITYVQTFDLESYCL